jgi:hypothetical protein
MNDTRYGLTAGVFTPDEARARALLAQVNAGSVYWNCCDRVSPRLPWSGYGDSGVGLTLSTYGIQTFTRPKAWHLRSLDIQALTMKLTLFDLDHTVLNGDSDVLWCDFLIEKGVLGKTEFTARNADMAARYKAGTVGLKEFADFYVGTLAGRTPRSGSRCGRSSWPSGSCRASRRPPSRWSTSTWRPATWSS